MSYRLWTRDISSKVLPYDDDCSALRKTNRKRVRREENGNKIKILQKLSRESRKIIMISNFSVMNQKSIKAKHYGPKNCKSNKDKCRERRGKKSICILSCVISITISFLTNSHFGLMATNSRMPNKIIQKLHKPHHNAKKKRRFLINSFLSVYTQLTSR